MGKAKLIALPGSAAKKAMASPRQALLALAMTAGFIAFCAVEFGVRFEVNDDAILSNIASGAYGPDVLRLVYVNPLVSLLLRPFYRIAPHLNWFFIVLFIGGALCFWAFGLLLMRACGTLRGAALFTVLLAAGGFAFFTRFHYVQYGALFCATGLFFVAQSLGHNGRATWLGAALAAFGSMLRFDIFIAIVALALPLLVLRFIRCAPERRLRAAVAVVVVVVAAFLLRGVDTAFYSFDKSWAEYQAFNDVRTEISDYRYQFAEPEDLAALGLSENDFYTIGQWSYYDDDVFGMTTLRAVEAVMPKSGFVTAIKTAVYTGASMFYARPLNLLFSAVLLGWLVFSGKRQWPAFAGIVAVLGAEVLYLCWRGRYPERITDALVLAAMIFSCACFDKHRMPGRRSVLFGTLLFCLFLVPYYQTAHANMQDYWASRPPRAADLDTLAADKDHLYLLDTDLVDAANGYDVLHPRPAGYFSNLVFVGSWLMDSPPQNEVLAAYGLVNPYRDAIDNPTVLLADYYHRALKETYLREHYAPDAAVELAAEHKSYNLYRLVSEPTD